MIWFAGKPWPNARQAPSAADQGCHDRTPDYDSALDDDIGEICCG
jgi:hypothetical protein